MKPKEFSRLSRKKLEAISKDTKHPFCIKAQQRLGMLKPKLKNG